MVGRPRRRTRRDRERGGSACSTSALMRTPERKKKKKNPPSLRRRPIPHADVLGLLARRQGPAGLCERGLMVSGVNGGPLGGWGGAPVHSSATNAAGRRHALARRPSQPLRGVTTSPRLHGECPAQRTCRSSLPSLSLSFSLSLTQTHITHIKPLIFLQGRHVGGRRGRPGGRLRTRPRQPLQPPHPGRVGAEWACRLRRPARPGRRLPGGGVEDQWWAW